MPSFLIEYTYEPSDTDARAALLDDHRQWLRSLDADGALLAAGVFPDGSGSALAFRFGSLADATAAANNDPFHAAGLVADRSIREWKISWGPLA